MKIRIPGPLLCPLVALLPAACGAPGDQPPQAPTPEQRSAATATAPDHAPAVLSQLRRLGTGMGFLEGPVWLPAEDRLLFSDIPRSLWMEWSEARGVQLVGPSQASNGNGLDPEGRLVTCEHGTRSVVRMEKDGTRTVLADRYKDALLNSPNDLAIQSNGTIWFTDPPWGLQGQVKGKELGGHYVFRLRPEGRPQAILTHHAMPNGIALSPDEGMLYVADTGGHPSHPDESYRDRPAMVTGYAVGDERDPLSPPLWAIATRCDGMCVDARGNIYTTGETSVRVWSPEDRRLLLEIPVPETPSNVCLGGTDGQTLFITARTSLYALRLDLSAPE